MRSAPHLLGLDIGSSSIKAALLNSTTGALVASATVPEANELEINSPRTGWAEQPPEMWWYSVKEAIRKLARKNPTEIGSIAAIGISYQMHGLVLVNERNEALRPSIIWCDSRAVSIGEQALNTLGKDFCLSRLFNSPGNFTASKLRWVIENEPEVVKKARHFMLPGDFIALKLTGKAQTTASGLSEGILWDFIKETPSSELMSNYGISPELVPEIVPTFAVQSQILPEIAKELGLPPTAVVSYRSGDQQNNALSLNVLNPGELAATAGTSGVIVGVGSEKRSDPNSRVNIFLHVNHTPKAPRYCTLLCINGTGILNSWLRSNGAAGMPYKEMDTIAENVPVGSEGLSILPYGNGAERSLGNRFPGASMHGIEFTRHTRAHLFRAAQEGIVFSLVYGLEIMNQIGIQPTMIRAGRANMFLSPLFREAFATTTGATLELFDTDGAQGAARGSGFGAGIFKSPADAFESLVPLNKIQPSAEKASAYKDAYSRWKGHLIASLSQR